MKKDLVPEEGSRSRVLSRLLADELRLVHGGGPCTPTITADDGHGHKDITNLGGDNDGCEV